MEDNKSEFIKNAYRHNKVRDLKEAFEEYPVEEEWHEGKVENVVMDSTEKYNYYTIGDIVFVNEYKYETGAMGKNHLFVIIDQNNLAVPIENFGMLISSNIEKIKYKENILLERNKKNGLHKDSIVKTDVVYKILNEQILFKIGKVDEGKVEEYKKSFNDNL